MSSDLRQYLIERFQSDGDTLRQRAQAIENAPKPAAGPDATVSRAMASACDEVAALGESLPTSAPLAEMIVALEALLPQLARRANDPAVANVPAVKSVYAGAATRIRELIAVESRGADRATHQADGDDDDLSDDDFDDNLSEHEAGE